MALWIDVRTTGRKKVRQYIQPRGLDDLVRFVGYAHQCDCCGKALDSDNQPTVWHTDFVTCGRCKAEYRVYTSNGVSP